LITAERASNVYKVVIDNKGVLDREATSLLRARQATPKQTD
jgi:hypothetical protein